MKHKEHIFVFLGQSFVRAAETFVLMLQTLNSEQRVPVLTLMQRGLPKDTKPPVLDFSDPVAIDASKVTRGSRTDTITIKVSKDSEVELAVLGAQADLEAFDLNSQVVVEHVRPNVKAFGTTAHLEESPSKQIEPELEESVSRVPPILDVTLSRTDFLLLKPLGNGVPKPNGEIIIESGFYNQPGSFGWLSRGYLGDEVLKSFTDAIIGTRVLRSDLFGYRDALEIIEFMELQANLKMSAEKLLASFNKTVCDSFIAQVALNLEHYNGSVPITLALKKEALRNAAVFAPLLYKERFSVTETESHAEQFKAIFARPVPTATELHALVNRDLRLRYSVTFFHEANREMLEQEIFRVPVDLPFYNADSCLEELTMLQNGSNSLQEHLERKERFYAGYQKRILRCCLVQLEEK